jgi:tetratricopeptide (TPR) repeat protein
LLQRTLDELTITTAARTLELGALRQADALALVQSLAVADGRGAVTASLASKICATSQGNPFLVVETVRSLREGTTFPAADLPLSKRVEHLVHSRVERLSDNSRSVVRVAAVIGNACDFAVMARAAQLPEARVADAVEEMVRRRILHVIGDGMEFTHDWLREVVYASLLPRQRRLLHEQVAAAWEAACSGNGECTPSTLTFHYRLAEVWDKTAFYARKAAEQAFAQSAHSEASALLEQARTALDYLPRTPEVLLETIDVRLALHRSLVPVGVPERTIDNLREIEKLIATTDDARRRAQLSLDLSDYFRSTGDHRRAIDHAQHAVVAARKGGCAELLDEAHFHLGHARMGRGEFRSAIALLDKSFHSSQRRPPSPRYTLFTSVDVASMSFMAWALAFVGDFALATKAAKEAIAAAKATDEPAGRVEAGRALGLVFVEKGDFANAIPLLEEALRLCQAWHLDLLYAFAASTLGYAYAISGRPDEGVSLMERAVEQRASLRGEYPGVLGGTYLLSRLADGYLFAGRAADATSVAHRTARLTERYDNPVDQARSLRLSGDIAARQDRPDIRTAEVCYAQSRAIAAALEMRPFVAHCDLRLGSLFEHAGRVTEGRAALHDALKAFTRLDMPFWVGRTRDILSKPAMAASLGRSHRARASQAPRR